MEASPRRTPVLLVLALSLALLGPAPGARAAMGDHLWSQGYDTGSPSVAATDGTGHVVTFGFFFGTSDFGDGPVTAGNVVGGDLFVARYDTNGNHVWSRTFTPVASFGVSNPVICADAAGNVYLGGRLLSGSVDLGGGILAGNQVFLAKFDSAGNHVWSASYGDGNVRSIDTDGTHLAAAGYTSAGMDFGGGTVGTAGGNDAWVARLTSGGAHVWSAGFGDGTDQGAFGVSIDGAGNLVVVGSMFGTVDFGGGPLAADGLDLFLASFDPAGSHAWSQVFEGLFTPGGGIGIYAGVDTGPSNEVVIAGEMRGTVDFGGGDLTAAGNSDLYVASFDAGGNHAWSALYGGATGTEKAMSVSIDGSGRILACGTYSGESSFGGATFPVTGSTSPFAAVYDASGAHEYSQGFVTSASTCQGRFDPDSDLVLNAEGWPSVDFGGGPVSPGGLVLAKLEGPGGGGSTGVEPGPAGSGVVLAAAPNPFRPSTRISYSLDRPMRAAVTVYDVAGRRVETLVPARPHAAGEHSVAFAAAGAAGVYWVRLETDAGRETLRVVRLR